MVSGNSEGGMHMYATEQTYVIAYLAISFGFVHGCIGLRTIRNIINCAYHRRSQLGEECQFGVRHTSRVGTGSSKLLSNLTAKFIAEKNIWEAVANNSRVLSSTTMQSATAQRWLVGAHARGWVLTEAMSHPV